MAKESCNASTLHFVSLLLLPLLFFDKCDIILSETVTSAQKRKEKKSTPWWMMLQQPLPNSCSRLFIVVVVVTLCTVLNSLVCIVLHFLFSQRQGKNGVRYAISCSPRRSLALPFPRRTTGFWMVCVWIRPVIINALAIQRKLIKHFRSHRPLPNGKRCVWTISFVQHPIKWVSMYK